MGKGLGLEMRYAAMNGERERKKGNTEVWRIRAGSLRTGTVKFYIVFIIILDFSGRIPGSRLYYAKLSLWNLWSQYRVTHQVVTNLPLTSKRNFCFEVNGRLVTT